MATGSMTTDEWLPVERWKATENVSAGECHRCRVTVQVGGATIRFLLVDDDEWGSRAIYDLSVSVPNTREGHPVAVSDRRVWYCDALPPRPWTDAEAQAIAYVRANWPERATSHRLDDRCV